MAFPRSREARLLLACATTRPDGHRIQRLLDPGLNWRRVSESAARYGVAGLLYSSLKKLDRTADVPRAEFARLEESYRLCSIHNLNLYRKLRELLDVFAERKLPLIVLKGAALAELVYGNIGLRAMRDLDLLVRKEDLERADRLVRELGYVSDASYHSSTWHRDSFHHLMPYSAPDGSLVLELHHHIVRAPLASRIPIEDLWRRSRTVELSAGRVLVLAPEEMLLHICLHLAYLDGFAGGLIGLCDIAEMVSCFGAGLDWTSFSTKSRRYGVQRYLYYPLWLSRDLMQAEIPEDVMRFLEPASGGERFAGSLRKFAIRRAALRPRQDLYPVPVWVVRLIFAEWLSEKRPAEKLWSFSKAFCRGYVNSARLAAPEQRFLAALYVAFVHPFYLILQTVGLMARRWAARARGDRD